MKMYLSVSLNGMKTTGKNTLEQKRQHQRGQPIEEDIRKRIQELKNPMDIKLLVTLSCTMCPDLVVAAQRIAAENPNVTAHVYDIRHFENLKNQYNVMSVPCLVINDEKVSFGKKNVQQVLDLIHEA